jgi:hypothetical protein
MAWGKALALIILVGLAVVGWRFRRISNHDAEFGWTMALILAVTITIAPKEAPYNQVLLIPPVLVILSHMQSLWNQNFLSRATSLLSAGLVLWPWLAALGITVAARFFPSPSIQRAWALPLYTSVAIPLAVFALMALVFTKVRRFP